MTRIKYALLALATAVLTLAPRTLAAVPTEASDAVTGLITDAGTFVGSFWPLLIAVVVAFTFMKLFKKGLGKAT